MGAAIDLLTNFGELPTYRETPHVNRATEVLGRRPVTNGEQRLFDALVEALGCVAWANEKYADAPSEQEVTDLKKQRDDLNAALLDIIDVVRGEGGLSEFVDQLQQCAAGDDESTVEEVAAEFAKGALEGCARLRQHFAWLHTHANVMRAHVDAIDAKADNP